MKPNRSTTKRRCGLAAAGRSKSGVPSEKLTIQLRFVNQQIVVDVTGTNPLVADQIVMIIENRRYRRRESLPWAGQIDINYTFTRDIINKLGGLVCEAVESLLRGESYEEDNRRPWVQIAAHLIAECDPADGLSTGPESGYATQVGEQKQQSGPHTGSVPPLRTDEESVISLPTLTAAEIRLQKLMDKVLPDRDRQHLDEINAILHEARKAPPVHRVQFCRDVNLLFEIFGARIRVSDGVSEVNAHLTVKPLADDGTIQFVPPSGISFGGFVDGSNRRTGPGRPSSPKPFSVRQL